MDIFSEHIKDFFIFITTNSSGEETNIVKKFLIYICSLLGLIILIEFIIIAFLTILIFFEQKHPIIELILLIVGIFYLTNQYFTTVFNEMYACICEYVQYKINHHIGQATLDINRMVNRPI